MPDTADPNRTGDTHEATEQASLPVAFDARLRAVPLEPGVYLMKDGDGRVIYVGKARRLRQRLHSYFGVQTQPSPKVAAMLRRVADFSFIVCANELEAFILESNLIKQYQPFYNILLKDDRDYPYLCITMQEAYPRILKAYRVGPDHKLGARYYGPYLNADLNRALRSLHDLFPLKTCRRVFPRDIGKQRPCLNYFIHRCIGPCLGDVSQKAYRALMEDVCQFLEGRTSRVMKKAKSEMEAASARLDFETAAVWRDRIRNLETLLERQAAVTGSREDCDVIGLAKQGGEACLVRLELRSGKICRVGTHFLSDSASDDADAMASDEEILTAFISQFYLEVCPPRRILLPFDLSEAVKKDLEAFLERRLEEERAELSAVSNKAIEGAAGEAGVSEPWLSDLIALGEVRAEAYDQRVTELGRRPKPRYRRVSLSKPERGTKLAMLDMARRSARENLMRKQLKRGRVGTAKDGAWALLAESLGLEPAKLRRVEAFDISNAGPNDMTASMVVFVRAKAERSSYRSFKIQGNAGQDDYKAMTEAVGRRLDRLADASFGAKPDLILLDGGSQHVAVLQAYMAKRGFAIPLAGMVKDGKHRTRGLALPDGRVLELAALASGGQTSQTKWTSARAELLLHLLTRIQDEAHRRASSHMRTLGSKRRFRYDLESVPGIGPARRKALLEAFPSVQAIAEADESELLRRVPRLGAKAAAALRAHFRSADAPQPEPQTKTTSAVAVRLWALADPHLSFAAPKPMTIFGAAWTEHERKIETAWRSRVAASDWVLLPGDISWAMKLEQAEPDLAFLDSLPGQKIIGRGNHDYWWHSMGKVQRLAREKGWTSLCFVRHSAVRVPSLKAVVFGMRSWNVPGSAVWKHEDRRLYEREILRYQIARQEALKLRQTGDRLILMLHFPPYQPGASSNALLDAILETRDQGLKLCVFGHVHGQTGRRFLEREIDGLRFVNTACDVRDFVPLDLTPYLDE